MNPLPHRTHVSITGWFRTLLVLGLIAFFSPLEADGPAVNFTGHYELADSKSDQVFALDLTQKGSKVEISFSASMMDGSGAAPDADGKGHVDKTGSLIFTFKDSFDNEGTGTLVQDKKGYVLQLDVTKTVESRPLRFYGTLKLKKTSNKPAAS